MLNTFILFNLIILVPIIIYGILISYINKRVNKNFKSSLWWIITLFGFIGTPIHEMSHLIVHKLFFHHITSVALYRPIQGKKDGVLGYVNFTYKSNSFFQNIGLFFGGIAPMIGGCLVLYFLMKFLLPNVFTSLEFTQISSLNFDILFKLKDNIINTINCIFTKYGNLRNLIIFLLLTFSISTHMSISPADMKNAKKGFIYLEVILLIISLMLDIFKLSFLSNFIFIASSYVIFFLTLGLVFSLISLGISYIVFLVT